MNTHVEYLLVVWPGWYPFWRILAMVESLRRWFFSSWRKWESLSSFWRAVGPNASMPSYQVGHALLISEKILANDRTQQHVNEILLLFFRRRKWCDSWLFAKLSRQLVWFLYRIKKTLEKLKRQSNVFYTIKREVMWCQKPPHISCNNQPGCVATWHKIVENISNHFMCCTTPFDQYWVCCKKIEKWQLISCLPAN